MLTTVQVDEPGAYRYASSSVFRGSRLTIVAEHILNENPYISACIVFGHGKFQNGVLVQPPLEYQFDPQDKQLLRAFRNMIWYALFTFHHSALMRTLFKADGRTRQRIRSPTLPHIQGSEYIAPFPLAVLCQI